MKRVAFLLALCACPPSPNKPMPDASDAALLGDVGAGDCQRACSNLAAIGCLEGASDRCVDACVKNATAPIAALPVACWVSAKTKETARACGGLRCE